MGFGSENWGLDGVAGSLECVAALLEDDAVDLGAIPRF